MRRSDLLIGEAIKVLRTHQHETVPSRGEEGSLQSLPPPFPCQQGAMSWIRDSAYSLYLPDSPRVVSGIWETL